MSIEDDTIKNTLAHLETEIKKLKNNLFSTQIAIIGAFLYMLVRGWIG